ncbi:MAG: CoA transferase [Actinobacteria bacterium]|nr:CoA transferase [Actinomycetota bacterium]MSW37873.1 CoA transferase [Actinomycetota bacterium]
MRLRSCRGPRPVVPAMTPTGPDIDMGSGNLTVTGSATGVATKPRPLVGVRVLDLTRMLPGAYATALLVGLGAEVLKVEDPRGGDGLRTSAPFAPSGEAGIFLALCRGKRSIALDLKTLEGRAIMLELVAEAEVLLDSFRPGVLDRLGLGADDLARANPSLVHVSMTAFGEGSRASLPGHDVNVEGFAGILGLVRDSDGSVPLPPLPMADMATGLQAALAVVSGLRVATDEVSPGFRADVTMLDSAWSISQLAQAFVIAKGEGPPTPDWLTGAVACYGVYPCADGLEIACGALEPKFFARIADLVGDPGLAALQYEPGRQEELRARLAAVFASRPRREWLDLLENDDTCVTPLFDAAQALADDDLRRRGVIAEIALSDGSIARAVRPVAWLPEVIEPDGSTAPPLSAPALGADSDVVVTALGRDPQALRAAGVLG